jgi:hypothetical protein
LDDIRAFRQTEFTLSRNLQASSVAVPRFAIRCGGAAAYAYKCRANLPSIERRPALSPEPLHASLRPATDPRALRPFHGLEATVRFKSVLIDFAAAH